MIHGSADNYIKPDMARTLFDMAGKPKEVWLVDGAKHNQSMNQAGEEYKHRVQTFFDQHLGGGLHPASKAPAPPGNNGAGQAGPAAAARAAVRQTPI